MPTVSVILPVYNAEKYLQEAMESILSQTFADFELLVLDDGSTDRSAAIARSFNDPRIQVVQNPRNHGLIFTLNRGIALAGGRYLARMDADDVALPTRFEKQVAALAAGSADVIATRVSLIDADGKPLPDWVADASNISATQIKAFLQKDNCLAHPSVMGKTEVFKTYRYRSNQKYSEDYDLWLRLLQDGKRIEKLPDALLLHRILPTSATRFKKINVYYRLAKVKLRFLLPQVRKGRLTPFACGVLAHAVLDLAKAAGKELKAALKR